MDGQTQEIKGLLSIAILSSNRPDLLKATISSLIDTITHPYYEIVVLNHSGSIGEGWNQLLSSVRGEFVLMCQEDWFFIEHWDWSEQAIEIAKLRNAGIIRLRKEGDGQIEEKVIQEIRLKTNNKDILFYKVDCIGGGFSMNPFIATRKTLFNIGKIQNTKKEKGVGELELRKRYAGLGFETYKPGNAAKGVCIHIGRGRRVLGKET